MPPGSSGQTPDRRQALIRAVIAECRSRRAAGEDVSDEMVVAEHPGLMPELGAELARLAEVGGDRTTSSAETTPAPPLSPDSVSRDSIPGYRIERKLSEGGQGVVYLAIQESTRRRVALKMMRGGAFTSRGDKARFDREVQVLGRLSHPNIVAIHDSGSVLGGQFFVMEYIAGRPLDQYTQAPDAPRSIADTLRLFGKVCAAINAAHLAGIIHRDLKPSNILVDSAGEPHILDFGLVKVPLDDPEVSLMTMTGHFVGSLPWASPEQAEGASDRIDMRTDVYSLGVILYQMLTGRFPYDVTGDMREVLERIIHAEPRRPRGLRREIDDETETIVLKCLNKDRERRYQSAGELARDIQNCLNGLPIEAKRDSYGYLMRKQLRRHKVPVAVGVGFLVLILVGLVTSVTLWRRAVAEGATARFRLEAARKEVSLSFEEYQAMVRRFRRAEEQLALSPGAARQPSPGDHRATPYRDASTWIGEVFPESPAGVPASPGTLGPDVAEAIRNCAGEPGHPCCKAAFAWLRANRDRVSSLVEAARRFQFRFGSDARGGRLVQQMLPSLKHARFAGSVIIASALLHHDESDREAAVEDLLAAARLSRYAGDSPFMISALVEIACRNRVYSAYRWMVADAAGKGPVPAAYVTFLERDLPFPDYEHASISEIRSLRQILNEAFVKTSDKASARLDLGSLRDLMADLQVSGDTDPYLDPSESLKADADALHYEQAVSMITELCDLLRSPEAGSFDEVESRSRQVEQSFASHPALGPLLPSFTRVLELRREGHMNRDATVIAVAIYAFRDAHGRWPQSIDEALASFPVSPYCRTYYGHDFVLRIVDGAPWLYAVGPNGIDDAGRGRPFESGIERNAASDDVLFLPPHGSTSRGSG